MVHKVRGEYRMKYLVSIKNGDLFQTLSELNQELAIPKSKT